MRLAILAFILIALSCNRNAVDLDKTNARGEVPRQGNLSFKFSHPLVGDSLLGNWDSTEYISFHPSIPGRFRWEEPDLLIFSPGQKLPPATAFTATINETILSDSKYGNVGNASDLHFFTPDLKMQEADAKWVLQDAGSQVAIPQIDVYFNYAVSPGMLKNHMKVTMDGKEISYSILTLSDDDRITLNLNGLRAQDKDLQANISLAKGIVPKGGTNATANDQLVAFKIPSPYNLVISDVSADHNGLSGIVHVRTSQQVVMENISSEIKIEPAVKFTVEQTDDGFNIKSDGFNANKSYLLTLNKGMRGRVGGVLQEEFDNNIAFGEMEPSLRFATNKSVFLSGKGNRLIELNIVNVPKIKVIVSKIYESNLLTAQRYGYYPADRRDEGDYEEDYGSELNLGDVIYEQEIDTRSLPLSGNRRLFTFDIEDKLPGFRGIYHIKVRSSKDYWVSDSRFIAVSDIGLIAKEGRDKLYVFTNSIKSAEPVSGVNIVAYGNNNQVLGIGSTNDQGVAEISYSRREFSGFRPAMIIAKTENDFNYLPFNDTKVNTSRFETGGKQGNSTSLDAFIYAERDIYRPGEKINYSVIVRDPMWNVPAGLPVRIKFLFPNGKELANIRKNVNEQGSLEGSVELAETAVTGSYALEIYSSNDVLLATKNFNVEEFVPDRIKVSASLDREKLEPGMTATLDLRAVNFFGPPAANRHYEAEIQVVAKTFAGTKFGQYDFTIQNAGFSIDKVVKQGVTNAEGGATVAYEVPKMFADNGMLQANFYTTVFDETGRPVSRKSTAEIYTQPVFFGIGEDGVWYFPLNQPVRFPLIAADPSGKVISGTAVVKMIRHEYRTVLAKSGSYFRYESQEEDKLLSEQTLTVSGEKSDYSFVPRAPGNYEIRIYRPGANAYVSRKFYSYGSWGGDNHSFEVSADGNIDIQTNQSIYKPEETAKLLFKAPFDGRLLVTLENDKVISYQYVTVRNRTAILDIKLSVDELPNVFVTATLFKAHGVSDIPLTVAHGFQNIKIEAKDRLNKVQIISAQKSRSGTRQQVTVKADPGSFVTLAAVDNGVLQVTDFKTPDPYHYFYAPRALNVSAYDLYPYLFPELRARVSSTGGDAEEDAAKRLNPMPSKRVKIISYWSGITRTNGNGQAKFEINLPVFSGQVRLMAVAYRNNTFGSAESAITVADPLVISTALPRFLSPNDSIQVPVTISNTTSKPVKAVAEARVTGPLHISGPVQRSFSVAPNSEFRVEFDINALANVDTGRVIVDIRANGEKFSSETAIGVRAASSLQVMSGNGVLEGGTDAKVAIPVSDFLAGSVKYKLGVSRNPLLELGKPLENLLQYPYGCTEQVISAAFPQLYFADLSEIMTRNKSGNSNANQNIMEAIRKIRLRQLYNGAVTLWDGEGEENWWSTIYAAHFLVEARQAGFDVDKNVLNGTLEYIDNRLRKKQTVTYYYNRDQKRKIAPKEVAYSLYVLALAGRSNVPAMNYYKANPEWLSLDSKYLLSVAYAISGDKKRFAEMLPGSFSGEVSVPQTGGSFYSPIRDEAISLNALLDADPGNRQIPVMAKSITAQLNQRQWYSTQEAAFSLLAIGKFARTFAGSTATAEIIPAGKPPVLFNGKDISLTDQKPGSNNITIRTRGKGKLFYFWQCEGISAGGNYVEEDKFIKVRRQFFDRYGKKLQGNIFHQNDLVIVQLSLEKLYGGDVENIVISDILPAGFEIENPRTKEIPGMDWIKDAGQPTAMDVRDDRINMFVDLTSNKQVYYYAVRAVSPGKFKMGPVAADAMYNGEYHSYNGGGNIEVRP